MELSTTVSLTHLFFFLILWLLVVVWDGIYVDFFYGLFGGLALLFLLRPHWGALYTQDKDVQDLGA